MKTKILVIDDENGVQDMIRGHFELRGYEVLTASDGGEGVRLAQEHVPDIVLLDLKMKQMDGDRALVEIRRILPSARIYVISAYQDERVGKRILGLGADAYFEKPVSIVTLERTIRSGHSQTAKAV